MYREVHVAIGLFFKAKTDSLRSDTSLAMDAKVKLEDTKRRGKNYAKYTMHAMPHSNLLICAF